MPHVRYLILIGWIGVGSLLGVPVNLSAQSFTRPQQAYQLRQEAYQLLFLQGKDSLALQKYQAAKALYPNQAPADSNLVDASFGIGIVYQMRGQYPQAIRAYRESVGYQQKINPRADSGFFYAYVLIAENYIHLNRYDSAYHYYEKAGRLLARYPQIPQALRFYNGLGSLYYLFGNYAQSTNYFEKVLKILNPANQPLAQLQLDSMQAIRYIMYTNNIASAHRKMGYYQPAIDKIKALTRYGILSNPLNQNIANAFLQLNQPDSALAYLRNITFTRRAASADVMGEKIEYFNSRGAVYLKTHQYTLALKNFERARQISVKHANYQTDGLALALAGQGQVYQAQKQYALALKKYQLALQTLHPNFKPVSYYQNPAAAARIISPLLGFEVFMQKAAALRHYYEQTRQVTHLTAALQTYQAAFLLADRIRKGYDSDEAKLFFTTTVAPGYEAAIATAFQVYGATRQKQYLHKAFALAENSKAAVLAESLRELEFKKIPGINPALLRQEINLKRNNAALQVKLVEDTVSQVRKEMYQEYLRENEIKLARIYKAFEKNKRYYDLRYNTQPTQVSLVQAQLSPETAVVEYFVGQENLYVFVITPDNFTARQIGPTARFTHHWQQLYRALYQTQPGYRYRGNPVAHRLYQQLLAPVAAAVAGKNRLIIIPDKELCFLPFEVLVPETANNHYLIQDFTISYAYSTKLLRAAAPRVSQNKVSVLALAPFGSKNNPDQPALRADLLAPLRASAGEVESVGGQVLIGPAATKQRLQQLVGQYDILHLATHAKANNQNPLQSYIAFYAKHQNQSARLYVPEIYNLALNKLKLVVLSACETGSGQLVKGEGIMSLARAFAYAGCPSIVTTLWQAEDQATAYITTRLHQHLQQGQPKDAALRLAKLDYLTATAGTRRAAPVYWANFIFIGDQSAIYAAPVPWGWLLVLAGLGLATGGLLYYFRRQHNLRRRNPEPVYAAARGAR